MEVVLWIAGALGLVALGATVTYLIGMAVPEPVFERAQRHGRYAGLGAADDKRRGGGRRIRRFRILPAAHPVSRLLPVRA
jgi:membrane protein YqaA with SNARE-associated domain